ncbi:ATP-binding protein [Streptomyces sp. NPDC005279]|uniref:ATP-binding protein n=1 Tax=Streptomyces sp. NPDC005279 TaxID=3364712 RepID=UPI0036AEA6A5
MPARTRHQDPVAVRMFAQRFSSTRLGARLARHPAVQRLDVWGIPYDSEVSDAAEFAELAELAANAVTHGRLPGRDFELRLTLSADTLRIEASDARGEKRPQEVLPDGASGRGLVLVAVPADR